MCSWFTGSVLSRVCVRSTRLREFDPDATCTNQRTRNNNNRAPTLLFPQFRRALLYAAATAAAIVPTSRLRLRTWFYKTSEENLASARRHWDKDDRDRPTPHRRSGRESKSSNTCGLQIEIN